VIRISSATATRTRSLLYGTRPVDFSAAIRLPCERSGNEEEEEAMKYTMLIYQGDALE
jgi:hypothetical protein